MILRLRYYSIWCMKSRACVPIDLLNLEFLWKLVVSHAVNSQVRVILGLTGSVFYKTPVFMHKLPIGQGGRIVIVMLLISVFTFMANLKDQLLEDSNSDSWERRNVR